ncbi:MAG: GIN domain-containing protein [Luteibaculaceae bacterium]
MTRKFFFFSLLIVFFASSISAYAQAERTFVLPSEKEIIIDIPANVTLSTSYNKKLYVNGSAKCVAKLDTLRSGDAIILAYTKKYATDELLNIALSVEPNTKLTLTNVHNISSRGNLAASNFSITANLQKNAILALKGDSAVVKLNGQGQFELLGFLEFADVTLSGEAKLLGQTATVERLKATHLGSDTLFVAANKAADLIVNGNGTLLFLGDADIQNQKITGEGKIEYILPN